jgi:hypothetical protein
MNVTNLLEAKDWILAGNSVSYDEGKKVFVCGGWNEKIHRFLSGEYERSQIQKVTNIVQRQLSLKDDGCDQATRELWAVCVSSYKGKSRLQKIIRTAERSICTFREDIKFEEKGNQAALKKWLGYGHAEVIFRKFPEFTHFMFDSNLLSQMKVSRDTIPLENGEPQLLVEGKWMKWDEVLEAFTFEKSERFGEVFVLRKQDNEVFTYLDNGRGLQLHHPYLSKALTPVSTIDDFQLQQLHEKACTFVRDGEADMDEEERERLNAERPFILQLVSSYVDAPDTNFHEFVVKRKHPYLRIVIGEENKELGTKKGDVYEIGYGWKKRPLVPFILSGGQFRSPDVWEYMPCEERLVTHIPISKDEANKLFRFTQRYHNESINLGREIGFHLGQQNCSVYIRHAFRQAGIAVPTEISFSAFLWKICPGWIQMIGKGIVRGMETMKELTFKAGRILPASVTDPLMNLGRKMKQAVGKVVRIAVAAFLSPLRFFLGEGMGEKGLAFESEKKLLIPPLWKPASLFKLPRINLPGVLQEWQRNQKSTQVFKSPRKFAIM